MTTWGHWYKSSRSAPNENCVEVRQGQRAMQVRDSKDPEGPVLDFDATAWSAFVSPMRSSTSDV